MLRVEVLRIEQRIPVSPGNRIAMQTTCEDMNPGKRPRVEEDMERKKPFGPRLGEEKTHGLGSKVGGH